MIAPSISTTTNTIEVETHFKKSLMDGKVSFIDATFPLFNLMYQNIKITSVFSYFTFVYWCLQTMFVSIWPMSEYWQFIDKTNSNAKIFDIIKIVIVFTPSNDVTYTLAIKEFVFLVLNIISFLIIVTQLIYYRNHRNFIKPMLKPIQLYDIIAMISIIPSSISIGENYLIIAKGNGDTYNIIAFFFAIINVFYEIVYHYITSKMLAKSVTLVKIPMMSFDPTLSYLIVNTTAAVVICTYVMVYFVDWAYLIAILIHFCIFAYFITFFHHITFFYFSTAAMILSVLITCDITDIFIFVAHFINNIPFFVPLVLSISSFIVFSIIFSIIFDFKKRNIIDQLNSSGLDIVDDIDTYISSLQILKSDHATLMYLTVGLSNACSLFTSLRLVEFLLSNEPSLNNLIWLAQITNFIPSESRTLNKIIQGIVGYRNLKFDERFLLYQIFKLTTVRQFASHTEANQRFMDIRNQSRNIEALTRGAFDNQKLNANFYEELARKTMIMNAIWRETLVDFPNNPKFCDEYCRYLIEAEGNFQDSIRIKHRQTMIESGKSFSVDHSFRSLVRLFPEYLTKDIIDIRGVLVRKSTRSPLKEETSFSHKSDFYQRELDFDEIDEEEQITLGRETFQYYKVRISLHKTLENRIPKSIKSIFSVAFYIIFIIAFIFLFIFFFTMSIIKRQTDSMELIGLLSNIRFKLALNTLELSLKYMNDRGTYSQYESTVNKLRKLCSETDFVVDTSVDFLYQSNFNTKSTINLFDNLLQGIVSRIQEGENVSYANDLMITKYNMYTCNNGFPVYKVNDTIIAMFSMFFHHEIQIASRYSADNNISDLFRTRIFCELLSNLRNFYSITPKIYNDLCQFQIDNGHKLKRKLMFVLYTMPGICFVVSIVPILVLHCLTSKSINKITEIINSLDSKTRNEAKEIITNKTNDEGIKSTEARLTSNKSFCYILSLAIISLIFVLFTTSMILICVNSTNNIVNLNRWDQLATLRLSMCSEAVSVLLFGAAQYDNPNETRISNVSAVYLMVVNQMKDLMRVNDELLLGTPDTPPCVDFDEILDQENLLDEEVDRKQIDTHALYEKASINTQLKLLGDLSKTVLNQFINPVHLPLDADAVSHVIHLFVQHLSPKMLLVTERIEKLASVDYDNLIIYNGILLVASVIVVFIYMIIVNQYYNMRMRSYKAALYVLKRIPPFALINNKIFSSHFLSAQNVFHTNRKIISSNIIKNSSDVIMFCNTTGIVEFVNPSMTALLGLTPEQVLGQNITKFFAQPDAEKLEQTMLNMKLGCSPLNFKEILTCVNESNEFVPCQVFILGMKQKSIVEAGDVKSFAVVLKDYRVISDLKKNAEEAKQKTDKLLCQVLPKDAVMLLNRGETNITHPVKQSTVVHIQIVDFQEYVNQLTSNELVESLTTFFDTIDILMSKYYLLSKIRQTGDTFVCAGGLFSEDIQPEKHAEQAVNFAKDVILELERINESLSVPIRITIGIDSGPVMCGIFGVECPQFDVIGNCVSWAERLSEAGEENFVHISHQVYTNIFYLNFKIKPRGKVFFKGKGFEMSFLVTAKFQKPSYLKQIQEESSEFCFQTGKQIMY